MPNLHIQKDRKYYMEPIQIRHYAHQNFESTHDQLSNTKCPTPQSASYYPISNPNLNNRTDFDFYVVYFSSYIFYHF